MGQSAARAPETRMEPNGVETRTTALAILVALAIAAGAATITAQRVTAQCSAGVPCGGSGGGRQKRPTPTPIAPTATPLGAAMPASVIQPAADCTPDPSNPNAVCQAAPGGGSDPTGSYLAQRPPNPNIPAPGPLSGWRWGEILVIVLIIAILLAIAIPTFLGARDSANARANGKPRPIDELSTEDFFDKDKFGG